MREKEMLWLSPETDDCKNKLDWNDRNFAGSRSFHTVEEYDALLERIHRFSTVSKEPSQDYCFWDDAKLQELNPVGENRDAMCIKEGLNLDHEGCSSEMNSDEFENGVEVDGKRETGWKRKAVAKGLKSLDVPTVEFPAIARFRQRIHVEGQDYSPGSYITPKFGSYNAPTMREKKCREQTVFSPELVAAFEDCMQQLQVEEDSILRHMDEYSSVDDEIENQDEVSCEN